MKSLTYKTIPYHRAGFVLQNKEIYIYVLNTLRTGDADFRF